MRISRIFRKYSRILLLVFMSLLLVVFLIGDVIGRASRSQRVAEVQIGTAFGEPVYLRQTLRAEDDAQLAQQVTGLLLPIGSDDPHELNLSTFLLLEEARHAGVSIGRDQIIQSLQRNPRSSAILAMIRKRTGQSLNSIYDSVGRVMAVAALVGYQVDAAADASLPELEQLYRDQNQEARVLVSVVDARAFREQVSAGTEEELLAHFEEGKDRDNEHTDETLAYGYRIADRVQIEYVTVDPDEIRDAVRVSKKERLRYYEDNKQRYTKTVEGPAGPGFEEAQPQQIQLTYEEVEDRVREDCRAHKAMLEAQRLVNLIHAEARRPWDTAPRGDDGVREVPPDEAIVPFAELQARFSTDYPVIHRETALVTQRELPREAGFGRAATMIGREPVRALELAFRVEGLATAQPDDAKGVLQVNEPGPVVFETRTLDQALGPVPYQAYVFRVVRVKPSGPPASLDEVRERVTENVRLAKVFEVAGAQASALAEKAREVGLEQAVAEADELKTLLRGGAAASTQPTTRSAVAERYVQALEPTEPERFLRQPSLIRNLGFSRTPHDKVFALVDGAGPAESAEEHRVVVVPLARNLKWAVIELLEVKPIYRGEFELQRSALQQQNAYVVSQSFLTSWFDPENIIRRTGYVPATPAKNAEEAEANAASE